MRTKRRALRPANPASVWLAPCATLVLITALAGCAKPAEPQPGDRGVVTQVAAKSAPDGLEGEVVIVARPGYVERGAVDPRFDWVTPYERETGCKVTVKLAGSSDEMVALAAQGGFDVVAAPSDASLRLVRAGHVQPIDPGLVPSLANVDPRLRQAPWHFVDGRVYGTPLQWAPHVLVYSRKAFAAAPTSWAVVYEPRLLADGRSNSSRVQAPRSPMLIADAALYLMAHEPDLGIADPYELTEAQYAAVLALLRRQRTLLQRYWTDAGVAVQDFASGAAVVASARPFVVNTLAANGEQVAGVIPAEGTTGSADTLMLAAGAKHPNCAHRWMEWMLNATVQGDVAAWLGSVPAVPAACDGHALLGDGGCRTNGAADFDRIRFWRTPGATCVQGECVPYERWSADFAAIAEGP
jgi:putative spermidine/putrescine transport system substrate-binding protein